MKKFSALIFSISIGVVALCAPLVVDGCKSASQTAYIGETAAYVSLKAAADGYKALLASGVKLTEAQVAQAHTLFKQAQDAELLAIDATVAVQGLATNGVTTDPATASAAETQTLTDLATFLRSVGAKI